MTMQRLFRSRPMLALAALVFAGQALPAQATRPGDRAPDRAAANHAMTGMMDDCPMMAAMQQGPDAALTRRQRLGLSGAQVARLEALRASQQQAQKDVMGQMMALHQELGTLAAAEQFDSAAVRGAFERMGALHTRMGVGMLRAQHDARAVLTPEQRKQLAASGTGGMMRGMSGMAGMMSGGMMRDSTMMRMMQSCPMMQGMMPGMMRGNARQGAAPGKPGAAAAPAEHHGHQMPAARP